MLGCCAAWSTSHGVVVLRDSPMPPHLPSSPLMLGNKHLTTSTPALLKMPLMTFSFNDLILLLVCMCVSLHEFMCSTCV